MNMHDKDMDALFRNKLADFEVEPSAAVWANINNNLGAQERRRSYAPLLKIAAGVAILVTAGMIFLTNKQGNIIKPANRLAVVPRIKATVTIQPAILAKDDAAFKDEQPVTKSQPIQRIAQVVQHKATTTHAGAINATQTITDVVMPTTVVDPQPAGVMAVANSTRAVVPDMDLKPAVDEAVIPQSARVLATNNTPTDSETKTPVKKRKIHGLGGLINAVVGAVDKREDKIIEFTDTDEGDAVTGINLGLFKVKKQK